MANNSPTQNGRPAHHSVSALTGLIKTCLESRFPRVYVVGEVSNCTIQSSGHVYFTLKDRYASISCVAFRSVASRLATPIEHGRKYLVGASVRVYEPRGVYQLNVLSIQPYGLGALYQEFERRKKDYTNRGYFDAVLKKKLPRLPRTIGLITSPTGAVLRDFWNVLNRRFRGGLQVCLFPVKVQGENAAAEIRKGIEYFNHSNLVELIVLARGGGSLEDLWAFNETEVVEAIHLSTLPVVSAVGHETDFTLADFVADVRAATPSVAAELVVPMLQEFKQLLSSLQRRLDLQLQGFHKVKQQQLVFGSHRLQRQIDTLLGGKCQDFDYRWQRLEVLPAMIVRRAGERFGACVGEDSGYLVRIYQRFLQSQRSDLEGCNSSRMASLFGSHLEIDSARLNSCCTLFRERLISLLDVRQQRLASLSLRLLALNPQKLLEKGYAILSKSGAMIASVDDLVVGDLLEVVLSDGKLRVAIEGIEYGKEKH